MWTIKKGHKDNSEKLQEQQATQAHEQRGRDREEKGEQAVPAEGKIKPMWAWSLKPQSAQMLGFKGWAKNSLQQTTISFGFFGTKKQCFSRRAELEQGGTTSRKNREKRVCTRYDKSKWFTSRTPSIQSLLKDTREKGSDVHFFPSPSQVTTELALARKWHEFFSCVSVITVTVKSGRSVWSRSWDLFFKPEKNHRKLKFVRNMHASWMPSSRKRKKSPHLKFGCGPCGVVRVLSPLSCKCSHRLLRIFYGWPFVV